MYDTPEFAVPAPRAEGQPLSRRELEVLDLVADGMTNRAVASRLGIAERTVREHVARIFLKLRVESRVEAAVIATEWRLSGRHDGTPLSVQVVDRDVPALDEPGLTLAWRRGRRSG